MSTTPPSDDPFPPLKERMKWMWSQGDYPRLAVKLEPEAIALARRCEISPGLKVFDIGAGNGNFAVAAARMGADVTASDLTPRMVELGRERTAVEGLSISWVEADAEDIPFPAQSFDIVASVFGAMFAPRPERMAAEMFRLVRPRGLVAMANYGVDGFLGRFADLMFRFAGSPPVPLPSPFLWGDPDVVRQRLGGHASSIEIQARSLILEHDSFEAWRELWEQTNPTLMTFKKTLSEADYERFISEARDLIGEVNHAADGRIALESAYLSVLARP